VEETEEVEFDPDFDIDMELGEFGPKADLVAPLDQN